MVVFPTTRWSLIRASDRQPGEVAAYVLSTTGNA